MLWLKQQLEWEIKKAHLRNGPDKNDNNNGNEHIGMQKRC